MPSARPRDGAQSTDAPRPTVEDLERYAGWLAPGAGPTRVRDGVKAIGAAIASDGDVLASVQALQAEIDKLGSGGVASLLRQSLRSLRVGLGEGIGDSARRSGAQRETVNSTGERHVSNERDDQTAGE